MSYEIILGAAVGLVAILLLVLRTNAGVVFFSLCAGSVLATQLGGKASLLSSSVIKNGDINHGVIYIAMIVLPALLSAFFMRGSVKSSRMIFNLVPAVAVGALMALLVVPLLPGELRLQLSNNVTWDILQQYQPAILVGGIISSVLLLALTSHRKDKKHHKK